MPLVEVPVSSLQMMKMLDVTIFFNLRRTGSTEASVGCRPTEERRVAFEDFLLMVEGAYLSKAKDAQVASRLCERAPSRIPAST